MQDDSDEKKPKTAADVQIVVGNQEAIITPVTVEPMLRDVLSYSRFEFTPISSGGFGSRKVAEHCVRVHEHDLRIPAGLVRRAFVALTGRGMKVEIISNRFFPERAQADRMAIITEGAPRILAEKLERTPRGLIVAPTRDSAASAIGTMLRVLPRSRTLIVVNSHADIRRYRKRLHLQYQGRVDSLKTYEWPYEGGRLVITLKMFRDTEAADFDTIILADAMKALSPAVATALANEEHYRLYGFVPAEPADRHELVRVEAAIGPVIHRCPGKRGETADVQVAWCVPPWSPPAPAHLSPLDSKRQSLWWNASRNKFIAHIAQAIVADDNDKLAECGLFVSSNRFDRDPDWRTITILVESVEHATALLAILPGWKHYRAFAGPSKPDPWNPTLHRILTRLAVSELLDLDTDVLILADGNSSGPPPACFPPTVQIRPRSVLLVDIADDADDAMVKAGLTRHREYRRHGWRISNGRRDGT